MVEEIGVIYDEMKTLLDSGKSKINFQYLCDIEYPGGSTRVDKVMSINGEFDFNANIAEELIMEVAVGYGTFNAAIFPSLKNLTVTLTREPVTDKDDDVILEQSTLVYKYKAVLLERESHALAEGTAISSSKLQGDFDNLKAIKLQLIPLAVNDYRLRTVSGIFRMTTVGNVLKLLIDANVTRIDIPRKDVVTEEQWVEHNFAGLIGSEIAPPDNERVYRHIIIPRGTLLIDLPTYLQQKYGVYKQGIGNFIKRGIVHVFPKYNFKRVEELKRVLTIVNLPPNAAPQAPLTYRVNEQGGVAMVSTGIVKHDDVSNWAQLNNAGGYQALNPEVVMDNQTEATPEALRAYSSNNLLSTDVISRSDGMEAIHVLTEATMNMYPAESKLSSLKTGMLILTWENAQIELLYPGMPVRIIHLIGDKLSKTDGVLKTISMSIMPAKAGIRRSPFTETAILGVTISGMGR